MVKYALIALKSLGRSSNSLWWRLSRVLSRIKEEELVELARRLISIPSPVSGIDSGNESKVAEFIADRLEKIGFEVRLQEVRPGRPNVSATMRGDGGGLSLMLNGHLDTVEAVGMAVDPYAGEVRGRRLHGRGAADMKAAMAAFIHVAEAIKREGVRLRGDLVISGCVDEEGRGLGGEAMARSGLKTDMALVGEPTGLRIGIATKGLTFITLRTYGRAAHGSAPELGVNAVLAMSRIIVALYEELPRRFKLRRHPLLGEPTLNVGVVRGGYRANVVPDICEAELDRRLVPCETPTSALEEVREVIRGVGNLYPSLRAEASAMEWVKALPMEISGGEQIVKALRRSFRAVTGREAEVVALPYWTDASSFVNIAGIPTVIFGPGELAQAHSAEEYVDIDALTTFAKVLAVLILDVCMSQRG
jgi:acetylornithine deacetylase/succinyl-diaminopimelate desuccinylase